MIQKKKLCGGCNTPQYIWSSKSGKKLCKSCAGKSKQKELTEAGTEVKPTNNTKRIAARSPKRAQEERIYTLKRIVFLSENPICQAKLNGCTTRSTECHHKAGKIGKLLIDETKFLAVCNSCHTRIENEREMAIELGFSELRLAK